MVYRSTNKNMEGVAKLNVKSNEIAGVEETPIKGFERLYNELIYQNSILRENVSELYTLSNRLKMREPTPEDQCNKARVVPDIDIMGSLWSESYRLEDLNEELREIVKHLKAII